MNREEFHKIRDAYIAALSVMREAAVAHVIAEEALSKAEQIRMKAERAYTEVMNTEGVTTDFLRRQDNE